TIPHWSKTTFANGTIELDATVTRPREPGLPANKSSVAFVYDAASKTSHGYMFLAQQFPNVLKPSTRYTLSGYIRLEVAAVGSAHPVAYLLATVRDDAGVSGTVHSRTVERATGDAWVRVSVTF